MGLGMAHRAAVLGVAQEGATVQGGGGGGVGSSDAAGGAGSQGLIVITDHGSSCS